ncbi:MAG: hypothetical protein GY862_34910 [Gammaproteobacteria bacterium]|nr:hypothetical protein [Gammaproteobacteria bacterium]
MTLDEYVLFFGKAGRELQGQDLKQAARHLYIGLGLDLPSAVVARDSVLKELTDDKLKDCGLNVPEHFEQKLVHRLNPESLPANVDNNTFDAMFQILREVIKEFADFHNKGKPEAEPFCCIPYNQENASALPADMALCRYVSLDIFEKYMLFYKRKRPAGKALKNKRTFYTKARIDKFKNQPAIFTDTNRVNYVNLGRDGAPVFFTPHKDAPHHDIQISAEEIASKMGLPGWLKWNKSTNKDNRGIMVLKFRPDSSDCFYRPTILDALDHYAFRPGPADDGSDFRYGYTRVCDPGELRWDDPKVTGEAGHKEVIMKNREERMPSDNLYLEHVFFFKP